MALLLALAALAMAPPSPCGWLRCGADLVAYSPREGDLVFFDDRSPAWTALFVLAGTGPPLHMGIVVRRLGGGMAILEAGPDDTVWVKLQDAGPRLRQFQRDFPLGVVQVRRCKQPLTRMESAALSRFAAMQDGKPYAVLRLLAQATPFRARGLLAPWLAQTRLDRDSWFCSELAAAAATVGGLLDTEVCANTLYPRDLVDDRTLRLGTIWRPAARWLGR